MNKDTPIIHIVDDNEALRLALQDVLEHHGFRSLSYSSAEDFLRQDVALSPGCLLLDMRMPGMSGLELQTALEERHSHLPVIFLSGHGNIRTAVNAVQNGAFEFLEKPVDITDLLRAIKSAVDKSNASLPLARLLDSLTDRERDVARQALLKTPNKIIAADLGITEKTVEFHKRNIREKAQAIGLQLA